MDVAGFVRFLLFWFPPGFMSGVFRSPPCAPKGEFPGLVGGLFGGFFGESVTAGEARVSTKKVFICRTIQTLDARPSFTPQRKMYHLLVVVDIKVSTARSGFEFPRRHSSGFSLLGIASRRGWMPTFTTAQPLTQVIGAMLNGGQQEES